MLNMFKYIRFPIFILSFAVGLILIYTTHTFQKKLMYIFPSPENVDKYVFEDGTDSCFAYQQKKVNCPDNRDDIFFTPIQPADGIPII